MARHKWVAVADGAQCTSCGLVVEDTPYHAGQYPLTCTSKDNTCPANGQAHLIIASGAATVHGHVQPAGSCWYCHHVWT
jgi:hypothetical protein